jgi:hypothetical protein
LDFARVRDLRWLKLKELRGFMELVKCLLEWLIVGFRLNRKESKVWRGWTEQRSGRRKCGFE